MQRQILAEVFILVVTASTLGLVLVTRHRTQLATVARDSEHTLRVAIRDALIGMYSIHLEPGRFVLAHVHDLTDREDAKRSLERMALHDPLTGLANRTLLFQRIGAARGAGRPAALLYLDLDGFKQVNDTYGHNAGDTVLIAVARRLAGAVRPDATVARLGGDEFAVLSPIDGATGDLPAIADRIRRLLREPIGIGSGVTVTIDVSIGVGTTAVADTADDLARAADQAMYAVKEVHRSAR